MGLLETSIISALLPGAVDALKGFFGAATRKWVGISIDDQIKLESAGVERLKALAQLDQPVGTPSQWVVDLRSSFRYIGAGASIAAGITFLFMEGGQEIASQLIAIPFSFIFGERMLLSFKQTSTPSK